MSKWCAVAGLLLASCCMAADRPATQQAATQQAPVQGRFDEIVRKLLANAERWYQDQEIDPAAEIALKGLYFEPELIPQLNAVLQTTKNDPNDLYVASRLLRQLSFAERKSIRAALPAVKALHSRVKNTYRPLPQLSEAQVKSLKQPASNNPKAQEDLEKRRQEKMARDRAVAKYDEMVYAVEKRTYQLMLQAQSIPEDEVLTADLVEAQKKNSAMFLTLVEALAADARKMSQERAEKIYDFLRPIALDLKMEGKRSYVEPGKATLREDDNSTFATTEAYPGILLLNAMNRIATAAKSPAMKVPTEKDIARYQADKKRQPVPPRKKKDRA